jgi:DNA polymerase-3 subunit gamma/tau
MLGTVGDDHLYAVLDALRANDVQALMVAVDAMEARSLSFDSALQSLSSLIHRIALCQLAPTALSDEFEAARLAPYAEAFDPEFLQLAYQIAIHGRDELPLAPDEVSGFSMTLLRLFAFRPEQPAALGGVLAGGGGQGQARALPAQGLQAAPRPAAPAPPVVRPAPPPPRVEPPPPEPEPVKVVAPTSSGPDYGSSVPPWEDLPPEADEHAPVRQASAPAVQHQAEVQSLPQIPVEPSVSEPEAVAAPVLVPAAEEALPATIDWHALQEQIGLGGFNLQLAQHSELLSVSDNCFSLRLANDQKHLLQINRNGAEKLQEALSAHFSRPVRVSIEVGEISTETPAQRNQADRAERHAVAVSALRQDPFVRELFERFDATLEEASVKPL